MRQTFRLAQATRPARGVALVAMLSAFAALGTHFVLWIDAPAVAKSNLVIRVPIGGMIDFGLAPLVERVVRDAERANADAIVVDINTLGGRVDAMIEIRDALVNAKVPTVAYVNPRAISAGALIAMSCDSLYMAPGASIGAATPVSGGTGEKASEKVVSYARTEFRSTAERKNRPPEIAAAMVDEAISIEGVIEEGKLLTLTAEGAVELKFAEGIFESLDDVLAHLDLSQAEIRTLAPNWGENIVRFLNNPVIAGLLMTIIFFGIIAEVQTAGWGLPGTAAMIALVLFLGGRYVVGLVGFEELILLSAGFILMLVEVFVIPGFGVVGFLGITCLLAALVMALLGRSPTPGDVNVALGTVAFSMLGAIVGSVILFRFVQRTPMWTRVRLGITQDRAEGFVSSDRLESLEGSIGTALTDLRPAGAASFNGKRYDVVSDSTYIERGKSVRVMKHEGYRIIVEELAQETETASS